MNKCIANKLLITAIVILFIPFLQSNLKLIEEKTLKGFYIQNQDIEFKWEYWFSEKYQRQKELYLNENFGFRNTFVRLNNQILYTCFNKTRNKEVIIGKQLYLFNEHNIFAYLGKNYIGDDTILKKVKLIKKIQDTLDKLNKKLIFVFCPGKVRYTYQYLPEKYANIQKQKTNYEEIRYQFDKHNIRYFDAIQFLTTQRKYNIKIYSKNGIHWSVSSSIIVMDTLIKYIEKITCKNMNHLVIKKFRQKCPKKIEKFNSDEDIIESMNLLYYQKDQMVYPVFSYNNDNNKYRPNILVVADSYFYLPFDLKFSSVFNKLSFWYYNKESFTQSFYESIPTDRINLKHAIRYNDIIMVFATETSLEKMGWGFYEDLNKVLFDASKYDTINKLNDLGLNAYEQRIKEIVRGIITSPDWYNLIKEKAHQNGLPIDTEMFNNARWLISEEDKLPDEL